jgi:hypothetical protein
MSDAEVEFSIDADSIDADLPRQEWVPGGDGRGQQAHGAQTQFASSNPSSPLTSCPLGNSVRLSMRGKALANDATRRRDPVVKHTKIIIIALTLAAWWLQLRQYFAGRLMKVQDKG